MIDRVLRFHLKYGLPVSYIPAIPGRDRRKLRAKLLLEETNEAVEAIHMAHARDHVDYLAGVGKELADVIVVALGTAIEFGLPMEQIWEEVYRSNMTKDGKLREDGKLLKGDGYTAPDIRSIIKEARRVS